MADDRRAHDGMNHFALSVDQSMFIGNSASSGQAQHGAIKMAHVILFDKIRMHGNHKHVFQSETNLNAPDDNWINDQTQSIVVVEGEWQFYKDWNFEEKSYLGTLGPGVYPQLEPYLTAAGVRSISSLRPIETVPAKSGIQPVKVTTGRPVPVKA
jgi:hypothetical protein